MLPERETRSSQRVRDEFVGSVEIFHAALDFHSCSYCATNIVTKRLVYLPHKLIFRLRQIFNYSTVWGNESIIRICSQECSVACGQDHVSAGRAEIFDRTI